MLEEKYSIESILSVHHWSPSLFSFVMTRPASFRFSAGQFARIGLKIDGQPVIRAYSVVSSPFDEFLEFFSIVVPDGALTPVLQRVQVGDSILLEKQSFGFLTLARYQQPLPQDLWLLATGTGLAPFLSILQDFSVWQQYRRIVLAYSVRTAHELAYAEKIRGLQELFDPDHQVEFQFIPIITRATDSETALLQTPQLRQRLPLLIRSGSLEDTAGFPLSADRSHVMLCGNPQMVEDTRNALKEKGLSMNRRGEGNIAVENYW